MTRLQRMLFIAVGLGVIAVGINLLDPAHSLFKLTRGELDRQGRPTAEFQPRLELYDPIEEPLGSEDAKVRIQVLVGFTNACHIQTISTFIALGEAAPELLRIEFLDTDSEAGLKASEDAEINCAAGLLINGKHRFRLEGENLPILLRGPLVTQLRPEALQRVLDHELRRQYGDDLDLAGVARINAILDSLPRP